MGTEEEVVKLEGQTAFITGGASGIGRAVATGLARERVNVVIGDISPDVEDIAREMADRSGGTVQGLHIDVSDATQVERAIALIVQQYGSIHILGNIAGTYPRLTAMEMSPDQWSRTIGVNLTGVFLCTHFALPCMVRQGYGRIISIASGLGVVGSARGSAYAASKAGLMAFTRSVASEVFEHNVTVNCIAPGITDTPLMRASNAPEEIDRYLARSGRPMGQPEDVVGSFLFLAGEAASVISGVTFWMRNP